MSGPVANRDLQRVRRVSNMLPCMLRTGRASSIDGTQIAFSEWGHPRGPAVVLIHGWLFSREAFQRQVHGELAERCRVIAYDLRGHGESDKPESLAAYADGSLWADDLDCVLRAVGMKRPVVAGWSLGGRVAVHYVFSRGAESVAGLNVIAARVLQPPSAAIKRESSNVALTSTSPTESASATARFIRACMRLPQGPIEEKRPHDAAEAHTPRQRPEPQPRNAARTGSLQQAGNQRLHDDAEAHALRFIAAAMAVPGVARQGASSWHIDYGTYFDELTLPTLVTHGDIDTLTSPLAAENIARRLRGKLSIYPNCGHMPFWEAPERFNHELADLADPSC
jgi:non-heme chloroperoxidase